MMQRFTGDHSPHLPGRASDRAEESELTMALLHR